MRFRLIGTAIAVLALTYRFLPSKLAATMWKPAAPDVYTGQCFANGEVNLVGNEAILAWRIQDGSWNGVDLKGFTVAAAVHAKATLGDPYADPYPAQSVLLVDDQANPQQQAEPAAFARHMGGKLLDNAYGSVAGADGVSGKSRAPRSSPCCAPGVSPPCRRVR